MKDKEPRRMEIQPEEGGVEIIPSNIGNLPSSEAAPLLTRAASRLEITKPRTEFWQGMSENLRGAAAYLKAEKSKIASKTFRAVAGASLVATMVSSCGPIARAEGPGSLTPTEAVATEVFTPTPEITPTPTVEPNPTVVPGQFEYDFQPDRPDYIPAAIAGAGGTGEIGFNVAESGSGEIPTETIKEEGYVPLVVEEGVLSAEVGGVTFLPYPERMLYENESGVLEELRFSLEDSGPGYAAYIDSAGVVRQKMLTLIPNPEAGTLVAAVSFNEQDRGTVYVLGLSETGSIVTRVRLVFDPDTEIRTSIVNGGARVYLDGERVLIRDNEFRPAQRVGLVGTAFIELGDIPEELTAPLSPETVSDLRLRDSEGHLIPYGHFNGSEFGLFTPEFVARFHARIRGVVPAELLTRRGTTPIEFFLLEIPVEEVDPETGNLEETGMSQFIIQGIPTHPMTSPFTIYWPPEGTLDSSLMRHASGITGSDMAALLRTLPQGTSIIIGEQIGGPNVTQSLIDGQNRLIKGIIEGLPANESFGLFSPFDFYLNSVFRR